MTSYSVNLSEGITESFFAELEKLSGSHVQLRKRLTEVTIELLQNIRKHAITSDRSKLFICRKGLGYSIVAINVVDAHDAKFLQDKIKYMNTLDHAQLKRQHKKILSSTTLHKKSGAGLGFYRIALRSASRLIPVFKKIDHHYCIFSLNITLTDRS